MDCRSEEVKEFIRTHPGKRRNRNRNILLPLTTIIHSEDSIIKLLHDKYVNTARYKMGNVFVFHWWETDFFVTQRDSGYCYDIEIKISRGDFFQDFKKEEKHDILATGTYKHKTSKFNNETLKYEPIIDYVEYNFRPNKFFYCVPTGLITADEVPPYAGLMYAGEFEIMIIKEAPFIHKQKLNIESKLCEKFYNYWLNTKSELESLRCEYNKRTRMNEKKIDESLLI